MPANQPTGSPRLPQKDIMTLWEWMSRAVAGPAQGSWETVSTAEIGTGTKSGAVFKPPLRSSGMT